MRCGKLALTAMLLLLVALSSCSDNSSRRRHEGSGRVYDTRHSFSIKPPKGWSQISPLTERLFMAFANTAGASLNVCLGMTSKTPEEYIAGSIPLMEERWKDQHFKIDEQRWITIDGKKTCRMSFRRSVLGVRAHHVAFVMFSGKKVYNITFTCPEGLFAECEELFDKTAETARTD